MKITVVINSLLFVQVSTSFVDVFQGAVHSVQNSFGKLFSDVVTDVKDTVDCTILAVEHVLSLSEDATKLYYDKCGNAKNETMNQQKEGTIPTVEISISNNDDKQNKLLPDDIDAKIDEKVSKYFKDYNPHDKLADVERELAKETERLGEVSELVRQELDKLSTGLHVNFRHPDNVDPKTSVDAILQELRLLEAIEQNLKNSSEANEIHKIIENVLHKLDAIQASEATESAQVEKVLDDLSSKSNNTYDDLRKRLENWQKNEDRNLNTIKKKIEEHEKNPDHYDYLQKNMSSATPEVQHSGNTVNNYRSTTPKENNSLNPKQPIVDISVSGTSLLPTSAQSDLANSSSKDPIAISPHSIEFLATKSVPPMLNNTDSAFLPSPSLNNNNPLTTTTMSIIPTHSSSVIVPTPSIEISTLTTPETFALKTTVKIYNVESSTVPNHPSDNGTETTAEKNMQTSTTPKTTKATLITTDEVKTTPKIENDLSVSNKTQISDISETSTPMAIISTIGSSSTTIAIENDQPDLIINTTLSTTTPSIKSEVDMKPTTYIMPSKISTDDSPTVPVHINESDPVTGTQSSVTSGYNSEEAASSSSTEDNQLNLTTPSMTTLQSLSAFLEYIDSLTATTSLPSLTTINTKDSSYATTEKGYDQPRRNEVPIPLINSPFPTRALPLKSGMEPRIPFHLPLPYKRTNDPVAPFNNARQPRTQFMPTESAFNENLRPIQPIANGNRPPDVFNERPGLATNKPSKISRTNNFDDPDYDAFFHLPTKDTNAHDQAVRDARKLMEDSIRSRRIMQNILNKKRKGISTFNLRK